MVQLKTSDVAATAAPPVQSEIDSQNALFWDELCGSALARHIGITDHSPESIEKFDRAFLGLYPYLPPYYEHEALRGQRVLEIGLGYGTLGSQLVAQGADYHGLDIAPKAVEMMRYRLRMAGIDNPKRVQVGSALDVPHEDGAFRFVYSIGCLHHTGNLKQAVSEVNRVLEPGGVAVVMLYNSRSFRQLWLRTKHMLRRLRGTANADLEYHLRARYDANKAGDAAPHTDYVSKRDVRRHLFVQFSNVRIDVQNFDMYVLFRGRWVLPRERFLGNIARILGTDLYIRAVK